MSSIQTCQLSSRERHRRTHPDRKSTRLNSSHLGISYAVFCLKKKKKQTTITTSYPVSHDQPCTTQLRAHCAAGSDEHVSLYCLHFPTLFLSFFFFFFKITGPPQNSPLFPNPPLSD